MLSVQYTFSRNKKKKSQETVLHWILIHLPLILLSWAITYSSLGLSCFPSLNEDADLESTLYELLLSSLLYTILSELLSEERKRRRGSSYSILILSSNCNNTSIFLASSNIPTHLLKDKLEETQLCTQTTSCLPFLIKVI